MATAPFGANLEAALKEDVQGGRFSISKGPIKKPRFFCCLTGTDVGVAKDPVAILHVNPTRQCVGVNITADGCSSWHPQDPAFVITNYQIDWGDGAGTGWLAFAGCVPHNHAYVAVGIYTVTLTVRDGHAPNLFGEDTVQVEIIDCTGPLGMGVFSACEGSGVWYTENGGLTWEDRSGGTLSGVRVYDLDVSLFSSGESFVLWAATVQGLYWSMNGGRSWSKITQPIPTGEAAVPAIAAVLCSRYAPDEVYTLNSDGVDTVWLYWSEDNGRNWSYLKIGGGDWSCGAVLEHLGTPSDFDRGHKFAPHEVPSASYAVGPGGHSVLQRSVYSQRWYDYGGWAGGKDVEAVGHLMFPTSAQSGIGAYDGTAWLYFFTGNDYNDVGDGLVAWAARADDQRLDLCDVANNLIPTTVDITPHGIPLHIWEQKQYAAPLHNLVFAGTESSNIVVYDTNAGPPAVVEHAGELVYGGFGFLNLGLPGTYYYCAAVDKNRLLYRVNDAGAWAFDAAICPTKIKCVMPNPTSYTVVGTNIGIYVRDAVWPNGTYTKICKLPVNVRRLTGVVAAADEVSGWAYTTRGIYRFHSVLRPSLVPPDDGRHYTMDMSGDGEYVYLALLDGPGGNPVILRVRYDLGDISILWEPGGGTWAGVKVDPNAGLWVFGDFAGARLRFSEDWGDTFEDRSDAGWADLIRPVLPSVYDPDDLIAIENDTIAGTAQAWRTKDGGITWQGPDNVGAINLHCGDRDYVDPRTIIIGRVGVGANNIRASINEGVGWFDRNAGFTANAPCSALIIVA